MKNHLTHRRLLLSGATALVLLSTAVFAQDHETKTTTKTKIELDGGKKVTVTGCVTRSPMGDYMLIEVPQNGKPGSHPGYALVSDSDLSKYEGARVEIKGQAVENGKGKVTIESKTKTETEDAPSEEVTTKTKATSGSDDMPFLGVTSVKKIANCH